MDAVEKVGHVHENRVRNNRIEKACLSNQRAPAAGFFKSNLCCDTLTILFEQYRPTLRFNSAKRSGAVNPSMNVT